MSNAIDIDKLNKLLDALEEAAVNLEGAYEMGRGLKAAERERDAARAALFDLIDRLSSEDPHEAQIWIKGVRCQVIGYGKMGNTTGREADPPILISAVPR